MYLLSKICVYGIEVVIEWLYNVFTVVCIEICWVNDIYDILCFLVLCDSFYLKFE